MQLYHAGLFVFCYLPENSVAFHSRNGFYENNVCYEHILSHNRYLILRIDLRNLYIDYSNSSDSSILIFDRLFLL